MIRRIMKRSVIALFTVVAVSSSAVAASSATPPATAHQPNLSLSLQHSAIIYGVAIAISFGTAFMVKLLGTALRNLKGETAE